MRFLVMCLRNFVFGCVLRMFVLMLSLIDWSFPHDIFPFLSPFHTPLFCDISLSSSSFRLSLSLSPSPLDARTFVYFYKLACPYFYPWSIVCSAKPEIYTFCQTCTCERALAINAIEYVHGSWGEATNSAERFIMYKDGMYTMSWSCGTMIQGTFR